MSRPKTVVFSFLGSVLDSGAGARRWDRWRPNVSLCRHPELLIDQLELVYQKRYQKLADQIVADIAGVSPETTVRLHQVEFRNAWDFEEVYTALLDFSRGCVFTPEEQQYLVHITTGTHVAQICLFLLTESRYFPAKLIQTSPPGGHQPGEAGGYTIIDLDLSKYDKLASRFLREKSESLSFLKHGIETRNVAFNALIEKIEYVAVNSKAPLLLMGPTGAGKSQLARRVYELKKSRHQVDGPFVEVNCATIRGDAAMSALFGHTKGAFTGAVSARPGLLRAAHKGVLFLDEIGELGNDEQALLLRALEEKRFLPVGADTEAHSDFQLLAGTNRRLSMQGDPQSFREDLLARINLWTFHLPALKDRPEDVEPNLDYELQQFARLNGKQITFNREAREAFLAFATSRSAVWKRNFRDLNACLTRMATLAGGARISLELVHAEVANLISSWESTREEPKQSELDRYLSRSETKALDLFDRVQLAAVLAVCERCDNISRAGRELFAVSRQSKSVANDADRLRKYLARFNLTWAGIKNKPIH